MKSFVDAIAKRYLWLVLPLALFAVAQGLYVIEGLWQWVGLHGYFVDGGRGDGSQATLHSVWGAFVTALGSLGLAGAFLALGLWHRRCKRAV